MSTDIVARGRRAPRLLVVLTAAALGLGVLGGATGAVLGGIGAAVGSEQDEHARPHDRALPGAADEQDGVVPAAPVAPGPGPSGP